MIGSLKTVEVALAGVAALLMLLIAGVLGGIGDSADWLPARAPRSNAQAQSAPHVPVAELASLSNTWTSPLFSTDRSPDIALRKSGQASSLAGLTLTGVILNGDVQVAFIRQKSGPALKVHRGERLPNGWTLDALTPLQARFVLDGRTESLSLPVLKLPPPSTQAPISLSNESAP
ncbi:general secretion pathway protein GspN [Pseudomonas huanghezhanensis]|uniref:general secretion pathway protein GspN n=1 Tax=Pseudomonas huanghezhanensis TaxID=3002903 RepID=UPI002285CF07|nr:general secretion pathway protein GspN [Pseudomonas sp. BSw22131]